MLSTIYGNQKRLIQIIGFVMGAWSALFIMASDTSANWQTPAMGEYSKVPPFVTSSAPPLVMLVMGRNHKLFYEAYNDASDLNEDGKIDVGYKPHDIDYYGYFDSWKYYQYDSSNERFEPVGAATDKKAPNGDYWSGDFLNYLTMTRMDAIRKVLYGGYRSTDTATETVLERAYIPQDAHSWGKEYESVARDGYNIEDYTPLHVPAAVPIQQRHLFASTSLVSPTDAGYQPLLRVMPNSIHRIWEWVSKEAPVADDSLEVPSSTTWQVVPNSSTMGISNVIVSFYDISAAGGSHPLNNVDFDNWVSTYAVAGNFQNSESRLTIDGSGNPYDTDDDFYMSIFDGTLNIDTSGTYTFAVDGDDAVEFLIDLNSDGDFDDAGEVIAGWYDGHGSCGCNTYSGSVSLTAGSYTFQFRHEEASGGDDYYLRWGFTTGDSTITDYAVRVVVADSAMPESNCKIYPDGNYKPTGLLQRYGESDGMYFGLMSGSYDKNTSGGVLRKNISSLTDEIDTNNGTLTAVNGIIDSIDKFRISGFNQDNHTYEPGWPDAWITTRPMTEGEYPDWGNPIAEMMYETLRYFGGKGSPTSDFSSGAMTVDSGLGLPTNVAWNDPYDPATGFERCAKPIMLVLSDINPTYDSDQLPGNPFNSFIGDLSGLDVEARAETISDEEGISGDYYVGQQGTTADSACTSKTLTGLEDIRGLCPEEPTKQGSYYSASVAYHGAVEDIHTIDEEQKVSSYMVGLASPLPRIEIPVGNQVITLVPFAKSVGEESGCAVDDFGPTDDFLPTNTIVDFYVEQLDPDSPTYGKFRINYEDVEQAADHDMDAIAEYEYQVYESDGVTPASTPADGAMVRITLTSTYASGCIIQHLGYIISGTTNDGTFLEIRDFDTDPGADVDYQLDTPNVAGDLPLTAFRDFFPGADTAASLLENPFWYAAKWGGFEDMNNNDIPDQQNEWDKDNDGIPDTYYYVTNPLRLEQELSRSFDDILARGSAGTAASVISNSRSGEGAIYQSIFYPSLTISPHTVEWVGQVHALLVDSNGNLREDSNTNLQLDVADDKFIVFDGGTVYRHTDVNRDSVLDPDEANDRTDAVYISDLNFLWSSNDWLNHNALDPINQRSYNATTRQRHIFTFVDDGDMVAGSNEQKDFVAVSAPDWTQMTDPDNYFAYLHTHTPYNPPIPIGDSDFEDMVTHQAKRIVDYIRGQDQVAATVGSVSLPAFRSRQIDYDGNATVDTWRLGDIVQSTPKLVAQPFEKYDLIYRDAEYKEFYKLYRYRRNMIYVGANDGMLHAFNAGFVSTLDNKFMRQPLDISGNPVTTGGAASGLGGLGSNYWDWDIGAEVWAYVPFNLLPHLYWLTEPDYPHVYYNDLEPKIFDAKIFPDDDVHPNGWGTVLVGGMRFGGGKIAADIDKKDGTVFDSSVDKAMSSAFYILDITNPELEPKVLAEITFPDLGYTTCFPAVAPIRKKNATTGDLEDNQWYLIFGSGPTGADGPDYDAAQTGVSEQNAVMYAIDLVKLGTLGELWTVLGNGSPKEFEASDAGPYYLTQFTNESQSSVSEPIAVDYTLDFSTDVVYFGESFGNHASGWGGKLRRIVLQEDDDSDPDPSNWELDSTLIDLSAATLAALPSTYAVANGQPIVAAATVGLDPKGQRWVFFGSGRYYSRQDGANTDQQAYYGIKEPYDDSMGSIDFTYDEVARDDLLNVSGATVNISSLVTLDSTTMPFGDLLLAVDGKQGWVMDLNTPANKERNLGQAVLAGDLVTFTSYVPSTDICTSEGETQLYALFYLTGTAYFKSTIGLDGSDNVIKMVSLGRGLSITPNIHVGSEFGSTAYIQTSTGAIKSLQQSNPGQVKSGKQYWNMDESACP